jgi:hypothetical protein
LDIQKIVSELERERERIGRAIASLVGSASSGLNTRNRRAARKIAAPGKRKKSGGITPAGRRRLSEAMKKRWAERKRKKS